MRVWTNGEQHLTLMGTSLYLWFGESSVEISDLPDPTGERREVLSASPSGRTIWLRGPQGKALRAERVKPEKHEELPWVAYDLVAVREDRLLAAWAEEEGEPARLGLGPAPEDEQVAWEKELEWGEPKEVSWPVGVVWDEGDVPWSVSDRLDGGALEVRIGANRHGAAVSSSVSGLVATIPIRGESVERTFRIPSERGLLVRALPDRSGGVFVAVCRESGEGALCHFDRDGRPVAYRKFWRLGALVSLDAGRMLVVASPWGEETLEVRVVDQDTLADVQTVSLGVEAKSREVDAHIDADRRTVIVGAPDLVRIGRLERGSWQFDEENLLDRLDAVEQEEDEDSEGLYEPYRLEGPPEVGYPVLKKALPPWVHGTNEKVELPFMLRSAGGEGTGLEVNVHGPAIEEGLLKLQGVKVGDQEADFEELEGGRWRAWLPDVALVQGVAQPFQPKPKKAERSRAQDVLETTQFEVQLVGKTGKKPGRALLSLEVGTRRQSAPIKWSRPVSVEES